MKILKDNYNKATPILTKLQIEPYPRNIVCDMCGSELIYDETDLVMGEWGCMHIICPLCKHSNLLDNNEKNIVLTVDNIEFPVHFHRTSVETGAKNCCDNEEIKRQLRQAINYFRINKHEYDWGGHITGNLFIHVHRYDGDEEYVVTVSNDFYTANIPFERIDY